ncbi:TetR/AcrR family transcriptional regulator [Paractinoplanes rhizophilus]|uniref:TetR/AcrR family transcriptional regulator n=1 Tax=Paractinoplanes rhizophilus TaxID=1416877 RepID=A0ABW2HIS6_9ACTN
MPRPTKQEIEDEILETAATLFARHGFKETSIQRVADAVGYSKTGLLHRFPTKEALQEAVIERAIAEMRAIAAEADGLPVGPERDRVVITGVAELAIQRPGAVALLLSGLMSAPESAMLQQVGAVVFTAFGVADPECVAETDLPRMLRIVGALGALAVTAVALHDKLTPAALDDIAEVGYDALGHAR